MAQNVENEQFTAHMIYDQQKLSFERDILYRAIICNKYNRTKAAEQLGITYRTLRYRCGKCGLGEAAEQDRIQRNKERPANTYTALWPSMRMKALVRDGNRCQCCGATSKEAVLHVDHIKPKERYPHLSLDLDNLQTLCDKCNLSKGSKSEHRF